MQSLLTSINVYRYMFLNQIFEKKWLVIGYLDVVQAYKRSFLGPLWITLSIAIQALSVTYIYTQVFNNVGNTDYYGFVVCGLISWAWISALLTEMGNVFISYGNFLKTANIESIQFVWAMAWKHTIIFFHNSGLLLLFFFFGAIEINTKSLFIFITFPILFLSSIPFIGVIGLLFTRYRDISRLVSSLITLLILITPVFWQIEQLNGTRQYLYQFNPLYYLVESLRSPLMGKSISEITWWFLLYFFIFNWTLLAPIFIYKSRKLIFWL